MTKSKKKPQARATNQPQAVATNQPHGPPIIQLSNEPPAVLHYPCNDSTLVLLTVKPNERVCCQGSFAVQCLAGDVTLNDFELTAGDFERSQMHRVCAPEGLDAIAIICSRPTDDSWVNDDKKFKRIKFRIKELTKMFERLMDHVKATASAVILIDTTVARCAEMIDLIGQNFLVHSKRRFINRNVSCFYFQNMNYYMYSQEDETTLRKRLDDINELRRDGQKPVVLVTGHKGAGKSTFVRNLVNRQLNGEGLPVFVLDCDVGQSEFTPAMCMSLVRVNKPIFDPPFCHQKTLFEHSYYYGDIKASQIDEEKYMTIVERLFNEFNNISEPGSMLIVNTMGWIEEFGALVIRLMLQLMKPTLCVSLVRDETLGQFGGVDPRRNWIVLRPNTVPRDTSLATPRRIPPAAIREFTALGYLSPLMSHPNLASFVESPPYRVPLRGVTLCCPEDVSVMPDRYVLGSFNAHFVALCEPIEHPKMRRIADLNQLPKLLVYPYPPPLFKCIGFGVVRAICLDKMELYLSTPVNVQKLRETPMLVRGFVNTTPTQLFSATSLKEIPYYTRVHQPDVLSKDLYSSLFLTTKDKRARNVL